MKKAVSIYGVRLRVINPSCMLRGSYLTIMGLISIMFSQFWMPGSGWCDNRNNGSGTAGIICSLFYYELIAKYCQSKDHMLFFLYSENYTYMKWYTEMKRKNRCNLRIFSFLKSWVYISNAITEVKERLKRVKK